MDEQFRRTDFADTRTAGTPCRNAIIERFCAGEHVFIAAGVSDAKDLALVSYVANKRRGQKLIIVPYEISEERLRTIIAAIDGRSLLYAQCSAQTDFTGVQVLIIDFLGALPRIYHYGHCAYIGGGCRDRFFARGIARKAIRRQRRATPYAENASLKANDKHNPLEAAACGLPVAWRAGFLRRRGPQKSTGPIHACTVRSGRELDKWLQSLRANE